MSGNAMLLARPRDGFQVRRVLVWTILSALAALIAYLAFRGYLSPEMLLDFANTFYC